MENPMSMISDIGEVLRVKVVILRGLTLFCR